MKKPTVLLVSSYRGYKTTYSAVLSDSFHVIARDTLPDIDDFIVKRAELIVIINLWKRFPDYVVADLAESAQLPIIVVEETEHPNIEQYAQRSSYLTVLITPVSNEQLLAALHKTIHETPPAREKKRKERAESAEKTFKSAYKSAAFRRKIERLIDYLHLHYAEIDNFKNLAHAFDINYDSMCRAVEYKTGMLPREYLREIRLEKMLQFIQFTLLSTEEICKETGYSDVSHARKIFKDRYGITIEECIAQLRIAEETMR